MQKIKSISGNKGFKDFLVVFIVVLVGLGAFGLGRLSRDPKGTGITIEYDKNMPSPVQLTPSSAILATEEIETTPKPEPAPKAASGPFFASNRGSKYYSLGCSGGKTLKKENLIYFSSEEQAILAGYSKSSSCK